ncbi:hypothetical protein BLOT_000516 [Blomia tropicalis]|nr:hypothetical protein BLOT_000516 [Blomia tropicalis]
MANVSYLVDNSCSQYCFNRSIRSAAISSLVEIGLGMNNHVHDKIDNYRKSAMQSMAQCCNMSCPIMTYGNEATVVQHRAKQTINRTVKSNSIPTVEEKTSPLMIRAGRMSDPTPAIPMRLNKNNQMCFHSSYTNGTSPPNSLDSSSSSSSECCDIPYHIDCDDNISSDGSIDDSKNI